MNEKRILRLVLWFVLAMIGLSLLFPHQKKLDAESAFTFSTTSDSRLYFKNIRAYWYTLEENEIAKINIYSHKKADTAQSEGLRLQILDQWNQDEASIQYYPIRDTHLVDWTLFTDEDHITFRLDTMNREDHVAVALWCFQQQLEGRSLQLKNSQDPLIPWLEVEQKAFEETLKDYFELVNFYR